MSAPGMLHLILSKRHRGEKPLPLSCLPDGLDQKKTRKMTKTTVVTYLGKWE